MSKQSLLATLLAATGISSAAATPARQVASGAPDLSAEDQTTGTEQLEQLVAEAHAQGVIAGEAQGRKAERERFGAVLTSPEAAGRMGLAITQLSTTDNTPEQIVACLVTVPTAAETVAPAPPAATGAEAGGNQVETVDPLRAGGDAIAGQTPLVNTGAAREPAGEMGDQSAINTFWDGVIASTSGITSGGVWDGLTGPDTARMQ
jgi:hypothetical protein